MSAKGKLLRQIAIAMLPILYLMMTKAGAGDVTIGHFILHLGWLYPIFGVIVITGASNAYNLLMGWMVWLHQPVFLLLLLAH